MESDDRSLLGRARAGDDAALGELVRRHDPVLATIARYVASADQTDTAVLQAWRSVLHGDDDGDGPSIRAGLVAALIQHLGIEAAPGEPPAASGTGVFLDTDEDDPTLDHRWKGSYADDVRDWGRFGTDLTGSVTTREAVAAAVGELAPAPRLVLLARDVAGIDLDRVAATVGLPPNEAGAYLHWARSRVRDALDRHLDDGPPR